MRRLNLSKDNNDLDRIGMTEIIGDSLHALITHAPLQETEQEDSIFSDAFNMVHDSDY